MAFQIIYIVQMITLINNFNSLRVKRISLCMHIWESLAMHKILKNCQRLQIKPIFLFLCPESISKMTRPDQTMTLLDGSFLREYQRCGSEIWHKVDSSLETMLVKFGINIFDSSETMSFLASQKFRQFF